MTVGGERPRSHGKGVYMQRLLDIIGRHGWLVQYVGPDREADRFGFGYTIGLTDAGLPELYVVATAPADCARILNSLARRSLAAELQPGTGYDVDGEMFGVAPASLDVTRQMLRLAHNLYGQRLVAALQVSAAGG